MTDDDKPLVVRHYGYGPDGSIARLIMRAAYGRDVADALSALDDITRRNIVRVDYEREPRIALRDGRALEWHDGAWQEIRWP